MFRAILLPACLLLGISWVDPTSARAEGDAQNTEAPHEPTKEECHAAVAEARALAETLPVGDLSRHFAEMHLRQALVEAGNNEFDDCLERAEQAVDEVKERRHVLPPGKTLKDIGITVPQDGR